MNELTLSVLLTDPIYKKWYSTPPRSVKGNKPQWRVWVQLDSGKWAKTKNDFWTYTEAFNWVVKNRKKFQDVVLGNLKTEYRPPVVKYKGESTYWPWPVGYDWCGYCRRPTQFRKFRAHHAFQILDFETPRCCICGVRQTFVKRYRPKLKSKLLTR